MVSEPSSHILDLGRALSGHGRQGWRARPASPRALRAHRFCCLPATRAAWREDHQSRRLGPCQRCCPGTLCHRRPSPSCCGCCGQADLGDSGARRFLQDPGHLSFILRGLAKPADDRPRAAAVERPTPALLSTQHVALSSLLEPHGCAGDRCSEAVLLQSRPGSASVYSLPRTPTRSPILVLPLLPCRLRRQQLPDTAARECSPSLPSGRDHTNLHRMAPAAVSTRKG